MSTSAAVAVAGPEGTGVPAGLPEPADRGSLTIADRVVERVAGYAATQVEAVGAAPRRVLGVAVGETRADTEAAVRARVDGHLATVSAAVAVAWPHSVRAVSARLREHIRAEVLRITDVQVAQVDLEVESFAQPALRTRRVE